ncbi:RING-3 [Halenospora varia]|nr:RING-3 [Halenospora varia]
MEYHNPFPQEQLSQVHQVQQRQKIQKIRQACDCCHARKIRCDGANPCANCRTTELMCTYLAVPKKKGPKGRRVGCPQNADAGKPAKRPKIVHEIPSNSGRRRENPPTVPPPEVPPPVVIDVEEPRFHPSRSISDELVKECVDAFFAHKFPIMPILDQEQTYALLPHLGESPEQYALITSICAVITLQPEILGPEPAFDHLINSFRRPTPEFFILETVRARQFFSYIDSPTLATVQTSFFLFAAFFCLGKDNSAWFYIREAMTVLQLLRLHEEDAYETIEDPLCATLNRRTFWLLFITERAYALQRHRPLTLQRTISLPSIAPGSEERILSGFIDLVSLFQNFDDDFISLWNLSATPSEEATSFQSLIQLQNILKYSIPNVAERTEIQQADLLISRQWLKTMVWQLSLSKRLLSSNPSTESMSFHYPVTIARDVVLVSRILSPKAFEANGVGILEKVFDIGCSLADVLTLHPNFMAGGGMEIGPRDYLMELVRVLGTASQGKHGMGSERFLRVLAGKADECLGVRMRGSLSESERSRCIEEIEDEDDEDEDEDGDVEEIVRSDARIRESFNTVTDWNGFGEMPYG